MGNFLKGMLRTFRSVVVSAHELYLQCFDPKRSAYYLLNASHGFDKDYYRSVAKSIWPFTDPIRHYLFLGYRKNVSPNHFFCPSYYLASSPDVYNAGVCPFVHYLKSGEAEGRRPNPLFCPKQYLTLNPDVALSSDGPLVHFSHSGFAENRQFLGPHHTTPQGNGIATEDYQRWQQQHENMPFVEVSSLLKSLKQSPLISVIVPVYNTDDSFLRDCLDSVLAQSYNNWELCIADDASTNPNIKQVLDEYQAKDTRIKVVYRTENGHISSASNSACELATGSWLALLDHDDLLHEHALLHVVHTLNSNPNSEFIYSDEDKIDANGQRFDPHFKSDWNLDLLYSQNYVSHLGVYKTEIVKRIGGFRVGLEGSQDYDLLLRYSREIDQSKIRHIPKILYHWRAVEGSTALAAVEKSYTTEAGVRALNDHFKALGAATDVCQGLLPNTYRATWLHQEHPLVSLLMPTRNGMAITKQAIDSILNLTDYPNYEIILIDNQSDCSDALAYFNSLKDNSRIRVLRYPHPFNYSAINNFAARQAKGSVLGLVNNDIEVINPQWLTEMVSHAMRNDIGCVGAKLYYPNNTIQHAGVIMGIGGVGGHSHKYFKREEHGYFSRLKLVQNLSAVTAACLVIRKSVFHEVEGLNESSLTIAFNDVDLCLKVKSAGYRNLWTPFAELYHHESISRGAEDNPAKVKRFNQEVDYMKATWHTDKSPDPYYSCNLTLEHEDFSIRDK